MGEFSSPACSFVGICASDCESIVGLFGSSAVDPLLLVKAKEGGTDLLLRRLEMILVGDPSEALGESGDAGSSTACTLETLCLMRHKRAREENARREKPARCMEEYTKSVHYSSAAVNDKVNVEQAQGVSLPIHV